VRRSAVANPRSPPVNLEARRQPLDVPLPGAGERFVEVVDVEQHSALWCAKHPEVREVGVAAELDDHTRAWVGARSAAMIIAAPR
jgi:hypothetical protein